MIIAIDGPAASGKGTLARKLAAHFGLAHLDTGSLYRAVAYRLLARGSDPSDVASAIEAARTLDFADLDTEKLRTREVSRAASIVAAIPAVRAEVLDFQRRFAAHPKGAVLDGRDIGTIVCPHADVKLFVTASAQARAHRRYLELRESDPAVDEAAVLKDIEARDRRDRERAVAPLVKADDAHLLDTTNLDIETAFETAVELIDSH